MINKKAEQSVETAKIHLKALRDHVDKILAKLDMQQDLEDWIDGQIARAESDLGDISNYLDVNQMEIKHPKLQNLLSHIVDAGISLEKYAAEYKGREVELNNPTKGDRKKYKVYVKNDKGNVVKVEFGDPNMSIKRDDPEARKNFRARHNCSDPGPRWKPRYWSCKFWSNKPVSELMKG